VKCDETRPHCQRCLKMGSSCDGYGTDSPRLPGHQLRVVFAEPSTLSSFVPGQIKIENDLEGHFINLFRHRIVVLLPGHTTSTLWTSLMLQALHEEPAIRHAAVALCASLPMRSRSGNCSVMNAPYSLTQYQKALKSLQALLSNADFRSRETALMTCLLLICFEVISGDPNVALLHLEYALQILKKAEHDVDDSLVQAFTRLDIQASSYMGDRIPSIAPPKDEPIPSTFNSLRDAESVLRMEQNKLYRFIRSKGNTYRHSEPGLIPLEVLGYAQDLQERLVRWNLAFVSSLKQTRLLLNNKTAGAISLLQIHHLASTILVANCLYSEETIYDLYDKEFARIITLSEKILLLSNSNGDPPPRTPTSTSSPASSITSSPTSDQSLDIFNFSVDTGIIQPLYVTASKCRIPSLRRHAISLLRRVSQQEGIWNGIVLAKIAQRVIEIEEDLEEGTFTLSPTEADPFPSSQTTPEHTDRDYTSQPRLPEHRRVHGVLRNVDAHRLHARIVCYRRLNGMDGEWDDHESFVHWRQEDLVTWSSMAK
jgi:hypothetical protein